MKKAIALSLIALISVAGAFIMGARVAMLSKPSVWIGTTENGRIVGEIVSYDRYFKNPYAIAEAVCGVESRVAAYSNEMDAYSFPNEWFRFECEASEEVVQ